MSLTPLLDVFVTDPVVRDLLTSRHMVLDVAVSAGARPSPDPRRDRHRA